MQLGSFQGSGQGSGSAWAHFRFRSGLRVQLQNFRSLRVRGFRALLLMAPKKRPAAKKPPDNGDGGEAETRKSRKGYKDWVKLRDALLPFIDKRFFTSYTTDRSVKKIDKKKLTSPFTVLEISTGFCFVPT